jgi:hypothetical protein
MNPKRGRGRLRRLQAGLVTPLPGGPGKPSDPTMGVCLEWLDAVRTKAGESRPDRGARALRLHPEATVPGTEIAAMERRGARTLRQRVRTAQGVG